MSKALKKGAWWLFAILCILVALYPATYFIVDRRFGLLASKSAELLQAPVWNVAFYLHIVFGGIALLIGWTQFSPKLRAQRIGLHRNIG